MKSRSQKMLVALVAILVVMNAVLLIQNYQIANSTKTQYTTQKVSIKDDVSEVYNSVYESVVTVMLKDQASEVVAIGSGSVIANDNGHIKVITNNHVVDINNTTILLVFSNGKEIQANIVGKDNVSDLALLEANVDFDVKPIALGDSDLLNQGETVIAIGSPLDIAFSGTVTKGIISGLNRFIETDTNGDGYADYNMNVIQTDTTINPGNSGGPLINMAGQLIGINTSKINMTNFEGMGFAIPVNEAIMIIEQLEKNGKIERPTLGIKYAPVSMLTDYAKQQLKISNVKEGIYISEVLENSSASQAGLKAQDVITQINGEKIVSVSTFSSVLYQSVIGDKLALVVIRDGKEIQINVTLKK